MSRVKAYKTRRETLLDNKRMLDFMALATDKPPEPAPRMQRSAWSTPSLRVGLLAGGAVGSMDMVSLSAVALVLIRLKQPHRYIVH